MKVSYNWLQEFIDHPLPPIDELVEGITFHAFEVEEVEKVGNDNVIDLKVLPDRAHDCLSHFGIAKEIAAIFDLPIKSLPIPQLATSSLPPPSITVEDPKLCKRYIGAYIDNVKITPSPDWMKYKLEAIGQRSINNVVDATNYILFKYGQPLHAFDADYVEGTLVLRNNNKGEKITTLDGKDIVFDGSIFLEADSVGPLAIAGIKGGQRAGINDQTKNLIVVAGNFDPNMIRRNSQTLGIRTDASKRFENELTPELAERGIKELIALLVGFNTEAQVSDLVDIYPVKEKPQIISISTKIISSRLGTEISTSEIISIFTRLGFLPKEVGETITCHIPMERLDLRIPEDLIDEVGRLYGYDKIPAISLPVVQKLADDQAFHKTLIVQNILLPLGFSEIYGYTFSEKGEIELANSLTKGKSFLRTNLLDGMKDKLESNLKNTLFDSESVKLFEIGVVFSKDCEEMKVAIGIGYTKKKFNTGEKEMREILEKLKLSDIGLVVTDTLTLVEFPLSKISEGYIVNPDTYIHKDIKYQKFSAFPRIIRDIALFVPEGTSPEEVAEMIKNQAGDLLVRGPVLFDEFHKDGRVSLAFRLVFQSYDRTLSDDEIKGVMDKVESELKKQGDFEVRS